MDKCFTLHNEDGYVTHKQKNMLAINIAQHRKKRMHHYTHNSKAFYQNTYGIAKNRLLPRNNIIDNVHTFEQLNYTNKLSPMMLSPQV